MKRILPFLFIVVVWTILDIYEINAQTTVSYIYDAAGRRIERNIIILKTAKPDLGDTMDTEKKKEVFKDSIGEQKVLIYPNPTRGELMIEIQGYKQELKTIVYLYNLSGNLLLNPNPTNSTFSLDLSAYAIGTYILKIVFGDKVSEWKIIKE